MSQEKEQQDNGASQENGSDEMSFAQMFDQEEATQDLLSPGQKVTAEIVRISKEWIFIDLGGKSEGSLASSELLDEEGNMAVKEGDSIEVYFLAARKNGKVFTTKVGGAAATAHLEEAYHGRIPVEGTIQKEIKGGFEIKIGSVRGFCPFSQIGLRRVADTDQYIGQTLSFKIIEFKEGGKNIIVSHRKILEEERAEKKEALKETLEVGQTVEGTITSVRDFGAFVDIDGIEGLIPISEISWGRTNDIHAEVEEGQQVKVAVKKLDWDSDRYSFSLRETLPDPWDVCSLEEGTTVSGTVARLADFGAFVTLSPGIDGLVHISKLGAGRRINHPREVVKDGDVVEVRIDSIDLDKKRISLSIPLSEEARSRQKKKKKKDDRPDDMRREFQQFKKSGGDKGPALGTFADLLKGKLGK